MWWLYVCVCVYACVRVWARFRYFSEAGVPCTGAVPLLGHLVRVTLRKENFVDAIQRGYNTHDGKRYFGLYQYMIPTLIPRDPGLIRDIMVRDFPAFQDRGVHIPAHADPLFGRNLIMLRGSRWRSMRSALSPAFSTARVRTMAPLMSRCTVSVKEYLNKHVRESGTEIDTNVITTTFVNDVIASCAFGWVVKGGSEKSAVFSLGQTAVVDSTTQVIKLFGYENFPTLMKWLGVRMIPRSAADQFGAVFKAALQARRDGVAPQRPDFIQTLVDAHPGKVKHEENNNNNIHSIAEFEDDDLVAQAVLFYVAGFDTTANLANYFLFVLATLPHLQDRLRQDTKHIDLHHQDLYDQIQDIEYLDMCVSETLRLWPLVGSADRRSVSHYDFGPPSSEDKHSFKCDQDLHVWIPVYALHRDARFWPEPDKFDPGRFSADRKRDITPYTYLPFGTGPRHCIGSKFALIAVKVLIVYLLRNYRVFPSPRTPSEPASSRLAPDAFILRPKGGFYLNISPL